MTIMSDAIDARDRVFVAGGRGLVGSAIVRRLQADGFQDVLVPGRKELDLTSQAQVDAFFEQRRPSHVFLAAAKVGGIHANNTYPADFIRDNETPVATRRFALAA